MYDNEELKKFGADKIVFLGMFFLSLLIAWLLVSINSKISFSKPIKLAHTGFSACVPIGKDWQSNEKWQYEDNTFVLSSNFLVEHNIPAVAVNCRYYLTSEDINPQTWLSQLPQDSNSAIVEKGEIQKNNLTLQWVHIEKPFTVYLASAELPNNRTIDIEVIQTTIEIDIADKVFKNVIDKLAFNEDNPLKSGSEIVKQLKSKGLDTFIDKNNKQVCFLIRDSSGSDIGFTIDQLEVSSTSDQNDIRGTSLLYLAGRNAQEQYSFFRSDKKITEYTWQNQTITRAGRTDTKIDFNQSGTIRVISQTNNATHSDSFTNAYDIVPSIYLELFISRFVQSDVNEVVIDVIDSSGRVTPSLIAFEPLDQNATEDTSHVIRLEPLDRDSWQLIYLDKDNHIIKETMYYGQIYNLEKTNLETIKQDFPRQAGDIPQMNQFPEGNTL